MAADAARFRLRLGAGVALRLRSSRCTACASLFTITDRRPKRIAGITNPWHGFTGLS
jgi:hypothetical protein